jgi:hypothetical protein
MSNLLKLYAPEEYWTAPNRYSGVNGCGVEGWKGTLVPDNLLGVDITKACNIHDWMYGEGKTLADKNEADRVFFNNMVRTINYNADNFVLKKVQLLAAQTYYEAVCLFGGVAYWEDKNSSSNFREVLV